MSRFFSEDLSALTPYTPGEQPKDNKYIKLNTNESPYPPSKKAIEYAAKAAEKLNLYPDPTCSELIQALAETYSVDEKMIITGNGSDEILFFAFSAFCGKKVKAVFPDITYGFYEVVAELCKVGYKKIPLTDDLRIAPSDYGSAGGTVFIANPNAPTGILLGLDDIERIVSGNPNNVVIIDEAYIDFGGQSAVSLIDKYDNLLVVQTFSKSRSMAGARLGTAFGSPSLIADLNAVKYSLNPYNINKMTLCAGVGVLSDAEYTKKCCESIIETRAYTESKLNEMGFEFTPSSANFIFARHESIGGFELYERLKKSGILVRHFNVPRIKEYNRITVGTKEQMNAMLCAVNEILNDVKGAE